MPPWIAALSVAGLVATVPLTWILRVLQRLPDPLALSHRQWPGWGNLALIGCITAIVTVFIRNVYYGTTPAPAVIGVGFLIVGLVYVFGFVLLVRQFAGLYPEYFVSTGRTGLALRKATYPHIVKVETLREGRGETSLQIKLQNGDCLRLDLPTRHLSVLYDQIESSRTLE